MKRFVVIELLYGGKWFYNKETKSYQQKKKVYGEFNTFKEAIIKWRELHKSNKLLNYKIECWER